MKKNCVKPIPVFCLKTGQRLGTAEGNLREAIRQNTAVAPRATNMMSGGGNRPWGWRPRESR